MRTTTGINSRVAIEREANVGIVWIDNPPVNALNTEVRAGLWSAVESLRQDVGIEAIVLACRGRTFVAGADIGEFALPAKEPTLPVVIAALEAIGKPTIAVIHGTAFGGGLELTLGCDYRIATPDARLGLPEVRLGFIPGAGGTVRLPYLIGGLAALPMVVTGQPISSDEALALGLVDAIAAADTLVEDAIAFIRRVLVGGGKPCPVRERREQIGKTDPTLFEQEAALLTSRSGSLVAASAGVEALRNAIALPFDEALNIERETFETLKASEQSKALRHVFFAERAAAKVEGVDHDVPVRPVESVGIVGGGTMGTGIAMAFANAGLPVVLLDLNAAALAQARARLDQNYQASVTRGSLTEAQKRERLDRISLSVTYDALSTCDLVIEAAFEDMDVKKEIFSKLDRIAKPGAILATNTSYLDVNEIASATERPGDVAGAHFFSPANVMKLMEIVRGARTAPDVLMTLVELGRKIGKVPVVVGVCRGFVGNRMLAARGAESMNLLLEGASPQEVDKAFTSFGWPMGPFEMQDLAGLDISWRNRKALGQTLPLADDLCELGRFGQKTGRGYYLYEAGSRVPKPDPELATLIETKSKDMGIARRRIDPEEIIERTLYPMINEGVRILKEGIASRSSDIDLIWIHGYGFPVAKGGPMFWAETEGMSKIVVGLRHWHKKTGRDIFRPAS
ncbi:3-hydroxyacyl-CoA dehydrogenase [Xaviernesmea oryzae]|uniref:3-hydroxyacyl-CoA dehydrogenase n=1 Tax=Xaviernesmea oryzae TaxID=464029 RepID=A0A1X7FQ85_9HYPH|nr:3-hydroxyacyl-CoA dehydrogenase NAD-binding domain-containing protein [Xaviernesmea oryzae]SMF56636.1 3-hydroxyacyl-CoA dehydrogenase [Xaviernesmea oryzae]